MKCKKCGNENTEGIKFCKKCGNSLDNHYKTCVNGHKYESHLDKCPHCPSTHDIPTVLNTKNVKGDIKKTKLDNIDDRTIVDNSQPVLSKEKQQVDSDRTVIIGSVNSSNQNQIKAGKSPANKNLRKLRGWLVTFDIDPNGVDFKIYEGKTKVGRSDSSDIVLKHPGISDNHFLILFRAADNKFIIKDEDSTNGTYLNGEIIERSDLNDNDIIKIGDISLKVRTV